MSYCKYCNLEILDDTKVCPFCQNILQKGEGKGENLYPDIRMKGKIKRYIMRVFIFVSIIASLFMVSMNFFYKPNVLWSLFPVVTICYTWFALRYCVFHNVNVGAKIMLQLLFTQLFFLFLDWHFGYVGWSLNYGLPYLIIVADGAILILMIANFMNWQSYLLYQIQLFILSLLPIILYWQKLIKKPIPMLIAMGLSLFIFVGTMVFGNTKAKDELLRRFHL